MPAGDWAAGDRGLAAIPERQGDFKKSLDATLAYAEQLECPRVHCLAGLSPAASEPCYRQNLEMAVEALAPAGVTVLIEPINQRTMPGYYLSSFEQAADTISSVTGNVSHGSLKLLFDVFHCQILHGDISMRMRQHSDIIGHVQIAGVPDRSEPDGMQEVNYQHVVRLLREELGYTGYIGCEYHPRTSTEAGLGWMGALSIE
eukprot:TRINITY_DN15345_c0_g1_i1.p1 TRINITY_DN15345_c0_g1~~TRINITY_DN15345_c0_g1_i1.p1  ORF type:complete len:202 (+),score=25.09 TRINITY_DN15345_c0_g1_i1:301-906(+)